MDSEIVFPELIVENLKFRSFIKSIRYLLIFHSTSYSFIHFDNTKDFSAACVFICRGVTFYNILIQKGKIESLFCDICDKDGNIYDRFGHVRDADSEKISDKKGPTMGSLSKLNPDVIYEILLCLGEEILFQKANM